MIFILNFSQGPFKTLYDLRKVTGFNTRLISALGPYLTVENNPSSTSNDQQKPNGHLHSMYSFGFLSNGVVLMLVFASEGHRRTASLPSGPLVNTAVAVVPSTPLLSSYSPPPFPSLSEFTKVLDETESTLHRNGTAQAGKPLFFEAKKKMASKKISSLLIFKGENGVSPEPRENRLRILSWNLDGLSVEKARNPGVVDVVGKLFYHYHIKIAVIQGVQDPLGLKEVSLA